MENLDVENLATAPTSKGDIKPAASANLIAGLLAGITASACCAGPFLLLTLGMSGSWIGNLSALEPLRPISIGVAVVFLWLAHRKIFRQPTCSVGRVCATARGKRSQQILFWITTVIVALSIAFPWYGPVLFD